jgi:hypothetical protein
MRYRIAALLLSGIAFVLIIGQLVDFTAFSLGLPSSAPDPVTAMADWLWSYRTVDVLIQGILLLAAVMGASAMFRGTVEHEEVDE